MGILNTFITQFYALFKEKLPPLDTSKETIIKRIQRRKNIEKRADDDLETILKRHETYMETTKPVLDFYSKNENFYEIDGTSEIAAITAKIDEIINV